MLTLSLWVYYELYVYTMSSMCIRWALYSDPNKQAVLDVDPERFGGDLVAHDGGLEPIDLILKQI